MQRVGMRAWRQWVDWLEPQMRLVLGLGMLLAALYAGATGLLWAAWAVPPALWLLWDAVRQSAVWAAFAAFREGRLGEVKRLTAQVLWPGLLNPAARAYYHWLRGAVAAGEEQLEAARVYLLAAAAGRLRTENDRALVHTLLAEVAIRRQADAEARHHIELASALSVQPGTARLIAVTRARLDSLEGPAGEP